MTKSYRNCKIIVTLIIVILFVLVLTSCGDDKVKTKSGATLTFEQIGYFKNDETKLRYFTFYVKSPTPLSAESIPDDVFSEIKDHGSKQFNTAGCVTASFYYIDRSSAPDITSLSAQRANDVAHDRKPIAAVWIMPKGNINLIKNP